ncbi:MAG: type VI secretion system baseplate subunit TssG, partial [Desulfobacteraceae bacterium]
MVTEKRRTRTVVRHNLLEDVCSFNFFKAVHLLEGYGGGRPLGKRLSPGDDPVRFRVKPGFSFPASDILS